MTKQNKILSKFKTYEMPVLIENFHYSKSAFGVNEEGELVFFNARISEKLEFNLGDIVSAKCIPNYEDKRSDVPWRCIFA
jgi:hypothetical protein